MAIDGCLFVSPGKWSAGDVPLTTEGTILHAAEAEMNFVPILAKPGDIVCFSGYLPHRSAENFSQNRRRAVFLTYNKAIEGDHRQAYYEAKHSGGDAFRCFIYSTKSVGL